MDVIKKQVVITRDVQIRFAEGLITEAFLDEFEDSIFSLSDGESRENELINYVAGYVAEYEDARFIEGVGEASQFYDVNNDMGMFKVAFTVTHVDVEVNS